MNWESMTDLIDRGASSSVSWVQVLGGTGIALLLLIVAYHIWGYIKLQWYVWKLNRMQRKAAEALAKRGGRKWPL